MTAFVLLQRFARDPASGEFWITSPYKGCGLPVGAYAAAAAAWAAAAADIDASMFAGVPVDAAEHPLRASDELDLLLHPDTRFRQAGTDQLLPTSLFLARLIGLTPATLRAWAEGDRREPLAVLDAAARRRVATELANEFYDVVEVPWGT